MAETRAGLRRWGSTDYGANYQRVLAHHGTGSAAAPTPQERTLGDLLTPARPLRPVDIVNVVSRDLSADVADWPLDRLMHMVALIDTHGSQAGADAARGR